MQTTEKNVYDRKVQVLLTREDQAALMRIAAEKRLSASAAARLVITDWLSAHQPKKGVQK